MSSQELFIRAGIAFCQCEIDERIQMARKCERRQWWELFWPAAYLCLMAISFYRLEYWRGLLWSGMAMGIATLNFKTNQRHLRWLRESKRGWAMRRGQWRTLLTTLLEKKERGFE
jgi:hypothetical protein